jgi:alkylhydroperoxidase family enzyme
MSHILKPLTEPYPEKVAQILDSYPQSDGYLLSLFRVFANSLRFLKKGVPNLLDRESPLALRQREIVILRVTALRGCEYEWGVHVTYFARHARLSDEQIADITRPTPDPAQWNPQDLALITAVDQMSRTGSLDADTLDQFRKEYTLDQQLEIMALCGTYLTVSLVANLSDLPPESFAARFPKA